VQQFAWDYAKYPNRRPLKELVMLIATGVSAIDDEMKQLSNSYADRQAALQDAKRKKGGNLLTVDLNDVLDAKIVSGLVLHDTEYLKTIFVGVPKSSKDVFEKEIYNLGSELVGYGGKLFVCCVCLGIFFSASPSSSFLLLLQHVAIITLHTRVYIYIYKL
jgi:V-type H+-transporting ATPase subunit C